MCLNKFLLRLRLCAVLKLTLRTLPCPRDITNELTESLSDNRNPDHTQTDLPAIAADTHSKLTVLTVHSPSFY